MAGLHLSPSHLAMALWSFLMAAGVVDVEEVLLDGLLLEGLRVLLDAGSAASAGTATRLATTTTIAPGRAAPRDGRSEKDALHAMFLRRAASIEQVSARRWQLRRRCDLAERPPALGRERLTGGGVGDSQPPPSVRMNCTRRLSARLAAVVFGTSGWWKP